MTPERTPVDLRSMCRALNPALLRGGISSGPPRMRVEPLPTTRPGALNAGEVLPVAAYVDGVQATCLLSARPERRPVYLVMVAAGAISPTSGKLSQLDEKLVILCSYRDAAWAAALPGGCPIELLDEHHADGLSLAAQGWVDHTRRQFETAVTTRALAAAGQDWVVVDGSIAHLDPVTLPGADAARLIGVVKTVRKQYALDEHVQLYGLPEGHVSVGFLLPAPRRHQFDRASVYLRQRPADHTDWTTGLVRIELPAAHHAELHAAAATAFAGRQRSGVGDPRWDRQQFWIARLEQVLHARIPYPLPN